ncbi:MAG TPA: serine/threonine-protein kinase, partial [Kofleriaceae bacterium]|nr:serine/threonine-protein kinase [Kofleriaceae bacterium]
MSLPRPEERELVGPYRVLKAIGAGGSARIDLAILHRAYGFERQVVLKRPLEHLRGDPTVAGTLQREAALGGRLVHPNLVAVLDAGTHDGYDYLALEYVAGPSLRELMRETRGEVQALPLAAVLSIIVGVARGLHGAHELADDDGSPLGLVHRDVSPANVLLGRDGSVKLSDFGIAKDTRVSTLSGSMRGTVTYMAPEQCRGHAFDRGADIFSLGVILHELLTRRRLFWADNDVASLHRVLSGDVPDPRQLDPSIAPELAELAMEALAYDALARIPTAAELADRLEAFAFSTGLVLGSRAIARAVAATGDSPRASRSASPLEVPDEPSLIAAIQGANEPIIPPPASAAPARPISAPLAAEPSPVRRSRSLLAVPLALALAGGGVIAWRLAQSEPDPRTPSSPSPAVAVPAAGAAEAPEAPAKPDTKPD